MIDVGQLYEAHRRELTIHVARQMHGEPQQDIEDVVQQAFTKAAATAHTYQDRGYEPKAWLYTIATNLIIDRRRRGSRKTEDGYQDRLPLCRIGPTEKAVATVQPDYARIENSLTLQPALDALTTAQRRAIVLRFWYGFSSTEIGYLMGTTDNGVKKLHIRALSRMRKLLGEAA